MTHRREQEALDPYDSVGSLAAEIEHDERLIKDGLIGSLRKGHVQFALQILDDWCTMSPRDIVAKYLEADDGNS